MTVHVFPPVKNSLKWKETLSFWGQKVMFFSGEGPGSLHHTTSPHSMPMAPRPLLTEMLNAPLGQTLIRLLPGRRERRPEPGFSLAEFSFASVISFYIARPVLLHGVSCSYVVSKQLKIPSD